MYFSRILHIIAVLFLFLISNNVESQQVINLIKNPDLGGYASTVEFNNDPSIVFNQKLYFLYSNGSGTKQLANYDGNNISLNPTGDIGASYAGYPIVYSKNLYVRCQNKNGNYQLAILKGDSVLLISNPDEGLGFCGTPIINGNNLYFQYKNVNGKDQLATFDGTIVKLISNPDNSGGLCTNSNLVVYQNNLFVQYQNSNNKNQLAKLDGNSLALINNPDDAYNGNGYYGFPIVFGNFLYFLYSSYNQCKLAKYDGNSITIVSYTSIYPSRSIVYKNNLYLQSISSQLLKYDGITISNISSPDAGSISGHYFIEYRGNLIFPYTNANNIKQLAKFDGINISLIDNQSYASITGFISVPPVICDTNLYYNISNQNYKGQLLKFDNYIVKLIDNPDNGGLWNYLTVNDSVLYFGYSNQVNVSFLAKYPSPPIPKINNFSPQTAYNNSIVKIVGAYFVGATSVTFGGIAANSFTVVNDSTITAIVGNGASGNVYVTTSSGTDSLAGFKYCTKTSSTKNASICKGSTYTFNGKAYSVAGTYKDTLTNSAGCDSVATLVLTVKSSSTSTTNAAICAGSSYTFNGTVYTTAGTYVKHLTNATGCDSAATLNLAVKALSTSTTNASICTGGSYTFNGTVYTTAGTYIKHLTNAAGCDSAATLNLTVKALSTSTTNASICAGGSYTFNGTVYTTAGTYIKHLINAAGCDSAATLNLTIKALSTSTTNASICSGGSYTFNGTAYTTAGTYVKHLTNAVGCDSAATLNLTVKSLSTSTTNASICSGSSYTFNGTVYTAAGTYVKHLTNSVGCDSAATLNLTVKGLSTSTTNASICSGGSYTFNGTVYTTAGTYVKHLTNAVGCDSAATLNLTVKALSTSTTNVSICSGSSYTFNGTVYTTAGTYVKHLTNSVGCDSAATLNLTVKALSTSTTNASICTGSSYTFNGTVYTTTGIHSVHFTNSVGCDSTATLVLTVNSPTTSITNASICTGGSYTFSGTVYTTAGTYVKHLTNSAGCDSAATLVLSVKSPTTSTTNASICTGGSYTFNGTVYSVAGTYLKHLTNAAGCDSAATLVLTVNVPTKHTDSVNACSSYTWNGKTYTSSGTYTYHTTNAAGCDSTVTLVLYIKTKADSVITILGPSYGCSLSATTQLTGNFVGGTWTSTNTKFVPIDSKTGIISPIGAASTTIKYYCATDSASLLFNEAPIRTFLSTITGPPSVCTGSTALIQTNVLSDSQNIKFNSTGLWVVANVGRGTIDQNGVLTGGSPGDSAIVQYKVTDKFGCTGYMQYKVLINALPTAPVISAGGVSTFKVGSSYPFTATPVGGSWSTNNTLASIVSTTTSGATAKINGAGSFGIVYKSAADTNGCSSTSTFVRNATTTLSPIADTLGSTLEKAITLSNSISIFPNPVKSFVTIKGSHISLIQVVDNMGRVIKTQNLKDATNPALSVGGLPVGVYHLRVQTIDGKVSGVGFVKE